MKASTTQPKNAQKEETKILSSDKDSNMTPFEVEITKKIRNKEKKLREITELRDKAKSKEFKPTD
jgi:predicted pyridoxine 5'-phosphate oxidase superfamily flavin-nucleotide-binding protein